MTDGWLGDQSVDVRAIRQRLGMSQAQVARRLGVAKLTVLRWEHGRARPNPSSVAELVALERSRSAGNLGSVAVTPLIGREAAVSDLSRRLEATRLVTLSGTGGVGKTRLAVATAAELHERFADGVWFVDLSGWDAPELLSRAVSSVFGVRDRPGDDAWSTLVSAVGAKHMLLVLDNCEHLLEACSAFTAALLAACPSLTILATSREPLGAKGEQVVQVLPLPVPEDDEVTPATVCNAAAADLFVQLAMGRDSSFAALTDAGARSVATICRRLDGLPLALELAAGWVRALSLDEIAARLDDRFRLLVDGPRAAPARQQTLRAAVDWSYLLLSPAEQAVFIRLSTFAGSFDVAGAEAVAQGDGVAAEDVLAIVRALVDKSLVAPQAQHRLVRYSLLESLRAYGRDKLAESGQLNATMERFVGHAMDSAAAFRTKLRQGINSDNVDRAAAEQENYRAAMQWLAERERWGEYLAIAGDGWGYWDITGAIAEARYWLERGLREASPREMPPATRARALGCLGQSLWRNGSLEEAERLEKLAFEIYTQTENRDGIAWIQTNLGGIAYGRSAFRLAQEYWEEALATFRELGERRQTAILLNNLGLIADREGDTDRAFDLIGESASVRREIGDEVGLSTSLVNLASLAARRGDEVGARAAAEDALTLARRLGQRMHIGAALEELARADVVARDYVVAEERSREALEIFVAIGYRAEEARARSMLGSIALARGEHTSESANHHGHALRLRRATGDAVEIGESFLGIAKLALQAGDPEFAARLLGAVTRILETATLPPGPEQYESVLLSVARTLRPGTLDDLHTRGRTADQDQLVEEALAWTERLAATGQGSAASGAHARSSATRRRARGPATENLSAREEAVMALIAKGYMNREVALELGLSVRTVERHVANACGKLGARGRTDAVRIILSRGSEASA